MGAEGCRSLYAGLRLSVTIDGASMATDPFFYHREVQGCLYNDENALAFSPLAVRFTKAQLAALDRDRVQVATVRGRTIEHLLSSARAHYVGQRELLAYKALCGDDDNGRIKPEHVGILTRHAFLGDYTSVFLITHVEVGPAFRGVGLGGFIVAAATVNLTKANDLVIAVGCASEGSMRLHESCPFLSPLCKDNSVLGFEMTKSFKEEVAALA